MVSCKWLVQTARKCSNWHVAQRQMQQKQIMISKQTYVEYQNSLPTIIERGLTKIRSQPEVCERLKRFTEYNVVSGKQLRGLLTVSSCQALIDTKGQSNELRQKIFALAWTVEMFHAFFLVTDDMEDGAKTRRGRPCWHMLPDVQSFVINDVGMFRAFTNEIIYQYFGKDDVYRNLVTIINDTMVGKQTNDSADDMSRIDYWVGRERNLFMIREGMEWKKERAYLNTHIGQFYDTMSSHRRDYHHFTMDRYIKTVNYKTAFYSFQFPIILALALSKKGSEDSYRLVESICTDVGLLLQMKNDFLDLYKDESVGGKSGTDIQEGKCSWLALIALKHCNQLQRKEFIENYGKGEQNNVDRIRTLYSDLNLPKIFEKEEKNIYHSVYEKIKNLPKNSVPLSEVFVNLVDMVSSVGNINYETEK